MATLDTSQQRKVHKLLEKWAKDPASSFTVPTVFDRKAARYEAIQNVDAELSSTAGNVGGSNVATHIKTSINNAFDDGVGVIDIRAGLSNAQMAYLLAAIAVIRAEEGVV